MISLLLSEGLWRNSCVFVDKFVLKHQNVPQFTILMTIPLSPEKVETKRHSCSVECCVILAVIGDESTDLK